MGEDGSQASIQKTPAALLLRPSSLDDPKAVIKKFPEDSRSAFSFSSLTKPEIFLSPLIFIVLNANQDVI